MHYTGTHPHSSIAVWEAPFSPKPGRSSACPHWNTHQVWEMAFVSLQQIAALALQASQRLIFLALSWETWISKDRETMGRWWSVPHTMVSRTGQLYQGVKKRISTRGTKATQAPLHSKVFVSQVALPSNSLQVSHKYCQVQNQMCRIALWCVSFKRS